MLGCFDDNVLVCFKPCHMGTTPEMSPTRHFDEETGLIGSKTINKILFYDHTVPEKVVGRTTGDEVDHFGSAMVIPEYQRL
jgi:hypothetical protein